MFGEQKKNKKKISIIVQWVSPLYYYLDLFSLYFIYKSLPRWMPTTTAAEPITVAAN